MAFIESELGGLMTGLGTLILCIAMSFGLYRIWTSIGEWWEVMMNKLIKYSLLEESVLDKLALKEGIDLNKEVNIRRALLHARTPKSIERRIRDQVYDELFKNTKDINPLKDTKK